MPVLKFVRMIVRLFMAYARVKVCSFECAFVNAVCKYVRLTCLHPVPLSPLPT